MKRAERIAKKRADRREKVWRRGHKRWRGCHLYWQAQGLFRRIVWDASGVARMARAWKGEP